MVRFSRIILIVTAAFLFAACKGEHVSPAADDYVFVRPENFPIPVYTFENNPVTKDGFELGRMLFYDPILSSDSTIACANCHQQSRAFSDPVHRFSKGVGDVSGNRNAPSIQNMAFQKNFFWDGGVNHLDFVPINAITSTLEMHETLSGVVKKLQNSSSYKLKFASAFGSGGVSSQKILFSLSQFMSLLNSSNSRYDKFIRNGESLTDLELKGFTVFQSKCGSCHATDLFTDGTFRNNGLDVTFESDSGRERITESIIDRGKFKVPSLRNVEITSPYMHDGRFKTLEQVIDHYRADVKLSSTLDPLLHQNGAAGLIITDDDKSAIIAFLKILTDKEFIADKRFAKPY